jgi:pimeloyl-ACP methyl ester carboxylesterase
LDSGTRQNRHRPHWRFWGGVQLGVDPFSHNPVEDAASMTMPTLLLYSERDPWILPAERAALANALRGPVDVVVFPAQGHDGPYVYSDAVRWDAAVRSLLDSVIVDEIGRMGQASKEPVLCLGVQRS